MAEVVVRIESSRERVLVSLIDTYFPRCRVSKEASASGLPPEDLEEFYSYKGSDSQGIALKVLEAIETRLPPDSRKELFTLFWLLNNRIGTLLLAGRTAFNPLIPAAFPDLPFSSRERVLLAWSQSSNPKFRKAFFGLKCLLMSTLFTLLTPEGTSPVLEAVRYHTTDPTRPPQPLPQATAAERCIAAALANLADCDGSQAGIARAAASLSANRFDIHWPGHRDDPVNPTLWRERPDFVVTADVVVVGSGAGGGVTAARLAAAGLRVVVVEKASFVPAERMSLREGESFGEMMESGGLLTTENGAMSVLAGSTVGGGTRVNWSASFKTPDHVRKEWAESLGLEAFTGPEYDDALEAVCERVGVRTGFAHAGSCSALALGLQKAGMHCGEVPRNCVDSVCSGYCTFGCARGAKQDTVNTYLADACSNGAKIITGASVEKIFHQKVHSSEQAESHGRHRKTVGVIMCSGPSYCPLRIGIAAPVVVSCAGSLHTPALLLRSGITGGGHVGGNLRLHPCTCVVGVFPPDVHVQPYLGEGGAGVAGFSGANADGSIRCSEGAIMSVFSRECAQWEGSGYGCVLYTPATHPGLFAAAAPWTGGQAYKDIMLAYPNAVPVLVLVRDTNTNGRVRVDKEGRPRLHYEISPQDKETMVKGMVAGLKAMAAAGASTVVTLLNSEHGRFDFDASYRENGGGGSSHSSISVLEDPAFNSWLHRVEATGIPDCRMATFSAHQMGTARLGVSPEISVLDSNGECWDVGGVYCCDGSTFPTSLGVNPMITIEAIAYMLAGGIAQREMRRKGKKVRGKVAVEYEKEGTSANGVAAAKL